MEKNMVQTGESVMVARNIVNRVQVDFGGENGDTFEGSPLSLNTPQLGLLSFLATVTMLFAGFTSAYLVRQSTGSDWQPIPLPPILWLNTGLLLLSSVTLELGRATGRRRGNTLKGWLSITTGLGAAFLVGQLFAWRHLAAQGVYLPSNPHSSFFYILTGAHGLHLLRGIGALVYVLVGSLQPAPTPALNDRLKLCATYWHFVGGIWLYLFVVLFVF